MSHDLVTTLINDQQVHCLIDMGSEVTTMEYHLYMRRLELEQLNPSKLSLKPANSIPIMQVFDQLVECVGVVLTHSPVVSSVPMVLDTNTLKDLD